MSFLPHRRHALWTFANGFGVLGLAGLLADEARASQPGADAPGSPVDPLAVKPPHFAPKAKRVIWLFMLGGVSHLETFDPKPALNKYGGKTIDESPFKKAVVESPYYRKNVMDFAGTPRALMSKLYPLQVGYKQHGRSGLDVSAGVRDVRIGPTNGSIGTADVDVGSPGPEPRRRRRGHAQRP